MAEEGTRAANRSELVGADLAARVRKLDPDRYSTALFAPVGRRPALFALILFNYEIGRVREVVTQTILGQARLQWWRDALEQIFAGVPPAHDVALALAAAIAEAGLDRTRLERMIDAREADLAPTPPARIEDLLSYAADSSGTLVELTLQALGVVGGATEQVGRAVGTAYALVGLARAIPFHARARRAYIPESVLAEHGLTAEDLFRTTPPAALPGAVGEIARLARLHLVEARELAGSVPRRAAPALLSATVAETYLARLERAGYDVFAPAVAERPPGLIWRLAAKAWTGRW
jgi:phytoene synthase